MIIHNPSQSLNLASASSVVLCSKEDESRYLKDLNDKLRKDRIKQVRD